MTSFYVHIPFCLSKCHYCDFYSIGMEGKALPEADYLSSLGKELTRRVHWLKPDFLRQCSTLFFGGGTPSLFSPSAIAKILESIQRVSSLSPKGEVTLEVNPKTADSKKLKAYRQVGVNRVSMGVQSLDDKLLEKLGRAHTAQEAEQTLRWILEANFPGVSVDLMYGLPYQDTAILEDTLRRLSGYSWKHLSAYELILEEHTPFYERYHYDQDPLPTTSGVLEMRQLIEAFAVQQGMRPYEISNYSRPGMESRHNLHYWNYDSFVGLGAGAVSFFRWEDLTDDGRQVFRVPMDREIYGLRLTNPRNLKKYLEDPNSLSNLQVEWIDQKTARQEFVMMGLRKREGIRFSDFQKKFSEGMPPEFKIAMDRGLSKAWLQMGSEGFSLTPEGILMSNEVIKEFMA